MKTASIILTAAALVFAASAAMAATATQPLTLNATVSNTAVLTVNPASISFPDADPDSVPLIPANSTVAVTAKAKTTAGATVTLTVLADDDLKDAASDVIGISAVKWTSTGAGFVGGTMAKTPSAAVSVASWTGSGNRSGVNTYTLDNSWNYLVGSYTVATTYTLTSP